MKASLFQRKLIADAQATASAEKRYAHRKIVEDFKYNNITSFITPPSKKFTLTGILLLLAQPPTH
jgi:hypothetical protein